MTVKNVFQELVNECKCKLGRDLKKEEVELIKWIQEQQFQSLFQQVKSS